MNQVRRILETETAPPTQPAEPRRQRPAEIPPGSWPRRMRAELAAGYCGETTVEAFIGRVGKEYPLPRVSEGRRKLWLKDDLDKAIAPQERASARDAAEDI